MSGLSSEILYNLVAQGAAKLQGFGLEVRKNYLTHVRQDIFSKSKFLNPQATFLGPPTLISCSFAAP